MTEARDFRQADTVIELLEEAARSMRSSALRQGACDVLPPRGRLLATGDLHDNPVHLAAVVELAGLDESPDHHLMLHELIHGERLVNGLDLSHRMLCRTAELVLAHPGQVHPVLANHELAQLTGRGVSKGAGNSVELFEDGLEYVFRDRAEEVADAIRTFIRGMSLAVRSSPDGAGRAVLGAHSVPNPVALPLFDQTVLDRTLGDDDYAAPGGAAYIMTWGRRYTPEVLEALQEAWSVSLFCLGHEHVEEGARVIAEHAVVLNSDHPMGMVVPIDLAAVPTADGALERAIPIASIADARGLSA